MVDFYDVRNYEPRESIGYLLALGRHRLHDLLAPDLATLGLTVVQAIVLVSLDSALAGTAAELCKRLRHDPGAMTRVLDRLQTMGLLRRERAPNDRRALRLELTENGARVLPEIRTAAVRASNRMLRGFTHTEAQQLIGLLKRLLEEA